MSKIECCESPEMYLKAVYLLHKSKGYCRHVDIANHLGVSKASVSTAVKRLHDEAFVNIDEGGMIRLTVKGQERARKVYDKYCFLENLLTEFGLDAKMAESEACKLEHVLSDDAFLQIRSATESCCPLRDDFLQKRDVS